MFGIIWKILKFWFWLLLVFIGGYVVYSNREITLVNLEMIARFNAPTGVVYFGFFLAGALTVTLHLMFDTLRTSFEIRRLKGQIRRLEHAKPVSRRDVSDPHDLEPTLEPTHSS